MNQKGLFFALITALISGVSIFINKYGVAIGNQDIFTFTKNFTVALFLTAIILFFKKYLILKNLTWQQWRRLILIGLIGGSLPFILFFRGLVLTTAAQGAFLHKTMFVFVAVLAAIFLKEKINKNYLIGGLLLILGNLMVLKSLHFSFGKGDIFILSAVLLWAIETILSKKALEELPSEIIAWGRMAFGAFFLFCYLAFTHQLPQLIKTNFNQAQWIIITSIFLFGYVINWYNGLKYLPASLATIILSLGAPITTLLTFFANGQITTKDLFSSSLIISGLLITLGVRIFTKKYVRA